MRIQNIYTPNFASKKPLVKKADDLVRHTNQQYPAFSPSYASRVWISGNKITKIQDRKTELFQQYVKPKFNSYRDDYDKTQDTDKFHLDILRKTKEYKLANCSEKCWLIMAALAANGYHHFCKASTVVKIMAIDKRTGEKAYETRKLYDHCAVVTTMKDEGGKIKDSIVIDPWLNKAMTYNEAQAEYLSLIPKWDMYLRLKEFESMFIDYMQQDCGVLGKKLPPDFDIQNYDYIFSIHLSKRDYMHDIKGVQEAQEFGKVIAQEFPELIIK